MAREPGTEGKGGTLVRRPEGSLQQPVAVHGRARPRLDRAWMLAGQGIAVPATQRPGCAYGRFQIGDVQARSWMGTFLVQRSGATKQSKCEKRQVGNW